jgi:hypothetical protein
MGSRQPNDIKPTLRHFFGIQILDLGTLRVVTKMNIFAIDGNIRVSTSEAVTICNKDTLRLQ